MNRTSLHSIRTTPTLWAAAKERADAEGVKMNRLIEVILEGYSSGALNLPSVTKTYTGPWAASEEVAP